MNLIPRKIISVFETTDLGYDNKSELIFTGLNDNAG